MMNLNELANAYVLSKYFGDKLKDEKSKLELGSYKQDKVAEVEVKEVSSKVLDRSELLKYISEADLEKCMKESVTKRVNIKVDKDYEMKVLSEVKNA